MTENVESALSQNAEISVVERILSTFIASVSAEKGFEEISNRLRLKLIEEKDHTDSALETAIFGSDLP